jgi:Papain-like cysteine protease AvrRpt2
MGTMITPSPAVARIEQKSGSTCWLACCKMLYKWKGKNVDDVDTILKKASETDDRVDYDLWCRAGIDTSDTVPLAKALGFKWGAGGKLEYPQLLNAIKQWGPMLAVGEWNQHSHVIVVAEIEETSEEKYYTVAKVMVANPWFGCPEREERNLVLVQWRPGPLARRQWPVHALVVRLPPGLSDASAGRDRSCHRRGGRAW